MKQRRFLVMLAAVALLGAACGGSEAIEVEDAWSRTSPMVTSAGVVYMDLTASEDDQLLSASVDSSIASTVELHETVEADMGDGMDDEDTEDEEMDDMEDMGHAMTMQPVDAIDLPAGETVSLEPGGLHIMLLELAEPLAAGQTFDLTLEFAESGELVVEIEVMDEAP